MDLSAAFEGLDDRERVYVESRVRGMSRVAANAAAGYAPTTQTEAQNPTVKAAIERAREISIKQTGIDLQKITEMLMDAYRSAVNATEMVMAARELGKLHDLYPSQKLKIDHTHALKDVKTASDVKRLSTAELMKLANVRGGDYLEAEFTEVLALPAPGTADDDGTDQDTR